MDAKGGRGALPLKEQQEAAHTKAAAQEKVCESAAQGGGRMDMRGRVQERRRLPLACGGGAGCIGGQLQASYVQATCKLHARYMQATGWPHQRAPLAVADVYRPATLASNAG
eukprot:76138-Chlamydomonas_euryale.AAC.1